MPEDYEDADSQGDLNEPPSFFPYDGPGPAPRQGAPADLVEVQVEGIYSGESSTQKSQLVLLTDGSRRLPIVIGPFEAQAILLHLEGRRPDRPITHDLIRTMLERLDATLDRVVIDDFWNGVYYAKLYVRKRESDDEIEIDSRPSDAVALAIRFEAPVFVSDAIMDSGGEE